MIKIPLPFRQGDFDRATNLPLSCGAAKNAPQSGGIFYAPLKGGTPLS